MIYENLEELFYTGYTGVHRVIKGKNTGNPANIQRKINMSENALFPVQSPGRNGAETEKTNKDTMKEQI